MFTTQSQFYKPTATEQKPNEVVDVTGWSIGGSLSYYPDGSRAKYEAFCPPVAPYSFLIPKHRYLFKKTFERKGGEIFYEQYIVEIIAYKLGRILGIEVPPAFIARNTDPVRGVEYASLIEWYYEYGVPVARGGDLMSLVIPNYGREKGKQHNFETISLIFSRILKIENWQEKWAKMLLFDAIIGNTDRHQENWEVLLTVEDKRITNKQLSPAFDNGTSMGYEILNDGLAKRLANLSAYIAKGTHHMKWAMKDDKNAGHFELLQKVVAKFPETENIIKSKLAIDISPIVDDIAKLTEFEIDDQRYRLSKERADFIVKLLFVRYNALRKLFNV